MTQDRLPLSGVFRTGLGQMGLGVLASVLIGSVNRVLCVEDGLPALVPAALIALHYLVQISRLAFGHRADLAGDHVRRVRKGAWIGGTGVTLACVAAAVPSLSPVLRVAAAGMGYAIAGFGIGMSGTALLTTLSARAPAARAAQSAAIVWTMMIGGIVMAAILGSLVLSPFTPARLAAYGAGAGALAILLAHLALPGALRLPPVTTPRALPGVLSATWRAPGVRRMTAFVACSMLGYAAQEVLLEPFAARVLNLPPGGSAALTGAQNGAALCGMALIAAFGRLGGRATRAARFGCGLAAMGLVAVAAMAQTSPGWVRPALMAQGFGNGLFVSGAVGTMLQLANGPDRGLRMGLWGAVQAMTFALGGLLGAGIADLGRWLPSLGVAGAFEAAFCVAALLYLLAATVLPDAALPSPATARNRARAA